MKKIYSILLSLVLMGTLFGSEIQFGRADSTFVDGPYIMLEDSNLKIYDIIDSTLTTEIIKNEFPLSITIPYWHKKITLESWDFESPESIFPISQKIFAISDIHGQHDRFELLLKQGGVMDEERNWTFGDGTMVIVGDIFDRGPQVTQNLWLTYILEQQAKLAGGAVHFILGNHEMMIMREDNRYIHEEYLNTTEKLTGYSYNELHAENSFLGRWLLSKNIVIKVGDILFNHAGLSPAMVDYSIPEINKFIKENYKTDYEAIKADEKLSLFFRSSGPLWYRGYFDDGKRYQRVTNEQLSTVLTNFGVNKIVVGHTTMNGVGSLFEGKVIYVDGGIKYGNEGEAVILRGSKPYKVTTETISELR